MRIGLASDTFGNVDVLERALAHFARAQVDRVFFLGGRIADLDAALARRARSAREDPKPANDAGFLSAVEGALARGGAAEADPLAGKIVKVASRTCPEYASGKVPKRQVDLIEGRICCLVHDKSELSRDDISNATVLFHGNSQGAALVQIGPRYFVTPGHLRAPAPKGRPATFAIADVSARDISLTIFSDEAEELKQERASFAAQGKMSVR